MSGSRGTITVFVTLIMIPVILLNAFIVDMTRVKLYGDQALMTADNYAEAALTNYDNLLKEMYGLFAMAQSEEGKAALDQIIAYMEVTSFNPNESSISGYTYDGFMPYSAAEVTCTLSDVDGANLANPTVLQTQIGDFMRFRIVQETMQAMNGQSLEDAAKIFDILGDVADFEKDRDIMEKDADLNEAADDLQLNLYKYYLFVVGYKYYIEGVEALNGEIPLCVMEYKKLYESDSVKEYYEYCSLDEEGRNEDKWKDYDADAAKEKIIESCNNLKDELSDVRYDTKRPEWSVINLPYFEKVDIHLSFDRKHSTEYMGWYIGDIKDHSYQFVSVANDLLTSISKYETARNNLEITLEQKDANDPYRKGIEEKVKSFDEMIGICNVSGARYTREDFLGLATYLNNNVPVDSAYINDFNGIVNRFDEISDLMSSGSDINWDTYSSLKLDSSLYSDFMDVDAYDAIMDAFTVYIKGCRVEDEDEMHDKQKAIEDETKQAVEDFDNEQFSSSLRDIPPLSDEFFYYEWPIEKFNLFKTVKNLGNFFSGSAADVGNRALLKYYTISYDFGMFSSRVSQELAGKPASELENKDVVFESLAGVEYNGYANYLYGAELEYIFAGYRESVKNLTTCKNYITTFRAVMNYKSTYTVHELNSALTEIRVAGDAVFPGAGFVLEQIIRVAITTYESIEDYKKLIQGESVLFNKTKIADFNIVHDKLSALLGDKMPGIGEGSNGLKLSYNQYLRIMVMLFVGNDDLVARTRTLISLNMNLVGGELGPNGKIEKLNFKASEAKTAQNSTCSVHLDFAVIPQSFLNVVADDSVATEISDFEKNSFNFSVVRGY